MPITIPLTGSGDSTADVATDPTAEGDVQLVKLVQSAAASSTRIGADGNGLDVDVVRIADGANVALGATGDASSANSVIGRLKKLLSVLPAALGQTTKSASLSVAFASDSDPLEVTGDVNLSGTMPVAGSEAHDAAATVAPVRLAGRYLSSPAKVSASGDVAELATTQDGKLLDIHSTAAADTTNINNNYSSAQTNTSQQSAPGANKRVVVVEIIYSRDTAGTMRLVEDPAGTPAIKFGPHYFPANGGMVATKCYIPLTANKALGLTSVGGGNETLTLRTIIENV